MVKSQKTLVVSFYIVALLLIFGIVLSTCGVCGDVSNDRNGADTARTELGTARSELEEQGRILEESQDAIRDSERAADEIERIAKDDARIIDECRGILASIRARAET